MKGACSSALGRHTFSSTRLDDEDILSSHTLFNLDACLAAFEFVQQHLGGRYAEVVADGAVLILGFSVHFPRDFVKSSHVRSELGVRGPAEDDNVAHHDASGGDALLSRLFVLAK